MARDNSRLRLFARLFTRPMFASLAAGRDWRHTLAYLGQQGIFKEAAPRPLSYLFDEAWAELRTSYRNEYVYKNEIANRIAFGRHRPHTASLHIELPVGRSIVDVAVFNGTSTAYEIKTEFDSTKRLKSQTKDYLKAFSQVYVVTHPSLVASCEGALQEEVGILVLLQNGSLRTIRPAVLDHDRLDRSAMFRCLRQSEYKTFGASFSHLAKLPNGLVGRAYALAFENLESSQAHELYVKTLRNRRINLPTATFLSTLPVSLRALGCATPLSRRQQAAIAEALMQPVSLSLA